MIKLTLKPGPKLILKKWKNGKWKKEDVTDRWTSYLFWPECKVKGATLRDVLYLLKSDLDFSKRAFNMWVEEFIEEGLCDPQLPDEDLQSLELYVAHDLRKNKVDGLPFPSVQAPSKDACYSIMYMPTNKLTHLPITLGSYSIWNTSERPYGAYVDADKYPVSLGQILYALIWELSYCGPPHKRDEEKLRTDKTMEYLDANGTDATGSGN